ncbi:pseudouridine synthase [Bacteroidota bacterium]
MEKKKDNKRSNAKDKKRGDYSKFFKKEKPKPKSNKKEKFVKGKRDDSSEGDFLGSKPKRYSKTPYTKGIDDGNIRLNKYIADAGVCSRREADKLIEAGTVTVNGKVVTELGTKVSRKDKVIYGGQLLRREKMQYVLLNKPKDFITTTDDPQARKTVMHLVRNACKERIYPVGRLDRNTTGVLLFTNDGEMAKRLTHPKHNTRKLYHVELNKSVTKTDLEKIVAGIELDDGIIKVDNASYVQDSESKKEIGIQIHSGRNRIVRRIFETLGYEVVKLDRVVFAGLTKKDIPRGRWRHLSEKEIGFLKMR